MFFDFHHHHKNYNYLGIYNEMISGDFINRYFSIGLHPEDIDNNWENKLAKIHLIAKNANCLAIGECGLDYRISIDKEIQIKVLKKQIQIAENFKKPLILHCVKSFNEIVSLCRYSKIPKIIHGFNKRETIAEMLTDNGFYLSFGSSLMNNLSLQEVFKKMPKELFFLETDNSNIDIEEIYNKASELRNISMNELQNIIHNNLNNLFGWKIKIIG